jgi:hypothetical protein
MSNDKSYKALTPAGWLYFDDATLINTYRNTYGYLVVRNNQEDENDNEELDEDVE